MDLTFIKIPLYKLNYVSNINEIVLDDSFLDRFREDYDTDERRNIFNQIDWAVRNPDYNFNSLVTSDKFTNKEIYTYIRRLHDFLSVNNED